LGLLGVGGQRSPRPAGTDAADEHQPPRLRSASSPKTHSPAAPHSRLADKAVGHQGRSSLIRELRAVAARFEPRSSSPAVALDVPQAAVHSGCQQPAAVSCRGLELRHRPLTGSLTVLPKLVMAPLGTGHRAAAPASTPGTPPPCPRSAHATPVAADLLLEAVEPGGWEAGCGR